MIPNSGLGGLSIRLSGKKRAYTAYHILRESRERLRLRKLEWKILAIVIFSELLTGLALLAFSPPLSALLVSIGVMGLLALGVPGWGLLLAIWTAAPLDIALLFAPTADFRLSSVALALYAGARILDALRRGGFAVKVFYLALSAAWLLGLFLSRKIRFPAVEDTIMSSEGMGVSIIDLLLLGTALVAGVFSKIGELKDLGLTFTALLAVKIPVAFLPLIFGFAKDETYLFGWRSGIRLEYFGLNSLYFALLLLLALGILYVTGKQLPFHGVVILNLIITSGLVLTGSRAGFIAALFLFFGSCAHSLVARNWKRATTAALYVLFLSGLSLFLALFPPTRSWGPATRFRKMGFLDPIRIEEIRAVEFAEGFSSTHNSLIEIQQNFGFFGSFIYMLPFILAAARLVKSYGAVQASILVLSFFIFAQVVNFFLMPIIVLLVGMYLSISTVRVEPVVKGPPPLFGAAGRLVA